MEIGNKITLLRNELKLSQAEFARQIKFKQPHINQMESGVKPITVNFLIVIHKSYRVNINWLLNPDSTEEIFIKK